MNRSLLHIILGFSTAVLTSCTMGPRDIQFGEDQCAECKMLISNTQFGAVMITPKGRMDKYDAIECMLRAYKNEPTKYAEILIVDYRNPGRLLDATKSVILHCRDIPSPMGAHLSGFKSQSEAQKTLEGRAGTIYHWNDITQRLNSQGVDF